MPSLRAAASQRARRCRRTAAEWMRSSSGAAAVICQRMTAAPRASPAGMRRAAQKRKRLKSRAAARARSITRTRDGVGAQSATATDQTTMIILRVRRPAATQPSGGRKARRRARRRAARAAARPWGTAGVAPAPAPGAGAGAAGGAGGAPGGGEVMVAIVVIIPGLAGVGDWRLTGGNGAGRGGVFAVVSAPGGMAGRWLDCTKRNAAYQIVPGVGAYLRSFRRKPGSDGNGWMRAGAGMAGKLRVMATPAARAGWWLHGRVRNAAGRA